MWQSLLGRRGFCPIPQSRLQTPLLPEPQRLLKARLQQQLTGGLILQPPSLVRHAICIPGAPSKAAIAPLPTHLELSLTVISPHMCNVLTGPQIREACTCQP